MKKRNKLLPLVIVLIILCVSLIIGVGFDNYECERARAGLYSATVEFAVNLGT